MNKLMGNTNMKIGLGNNSYLHRSSSKSSGVKEHESGILRSAITAHINKEDLNYKINTTASKNTRGRMSFKGVNSTIIENAEKMSKELSADLTKKLGKEANVKVSKTAYSIAEKMKNSVKLRKMFDFAGENSVLSEAIFAVLITCGLRPAVIMASPGKGEDKEKNQYAAAHSIASGIIGLAMTLLVSQPVKNAIDVIKDQIGSTEKEKNAMKSVLERLPSPVFLPLRAMATISMIPIVLGWLGIKKAKTDKAANSAATQQAQISLPPNTKKVFQSFAGVSQHENN